MTRHNPGDDALARTALERALVEILADIRPELDTGDHISELARAVAKAFEFVEYDRARTSVPRGNGPVHLRRFVLTGGWEVDPAAGGERG